VKLQVECENSTCDLNGIKRDYLIVNEVIYDRTDYANPPPLPPESNVPCMHSIFIDPSTIPNYGKRVVLLSSVSRVEKNVMVKNEVMSGRLLLSSVSRAESVSRAKKIVKVKNEVMSGRLFQSVYRVNSNINLNKRLQIVLPMFLQLVCE